MFARRRRAKLVAQAVAEIALGSHAHERRDAVVGESIEMIDQVLARVVLDPEAGAAAVPEVSVGVDDRRHHRLARRDSRVTLPRAPSPRRHVRRE